MQGPKGSCMVLQRFIGFIYGWLSKLWSLFGYPNNRCRIIIGTPKGTIIFDNHPFANPIEVQGRVASAWLLAC